MFINTNRACKGQTYIKNIGVINDHVSKITTPVDGKMDNDPVCKITTLLENQSMLVNHYDYNIHHMFLSFLILSSKIS